jgi:hypothetical protein
MPRQGTRQSRARADKRRASKEYWKKNKEGDSGGQDVSRLKPTPEMDAGMIFEDYRGSKRITAFKGGKIEMPKAKPC